MFKFSMLHLPLFLHVYLITLIIYTNCTTRLKRQLYEQFSEFTIGYKKEYLTNSSEFLKRFEIFKDNLIRAKYLNLAYNVSDKAVYGVNKFADLTPEEFAAQYLSGFKRNKCLSQKQPSSVIPRNYKSLDIPQKVDWREKGVLTGIKDQGTCGACWSFSTVETMESMFAIQYQTSFISVPQLSVQQLIDCDHGNNGCKGGDICEAAKWSNVNGVVNETLYPLTDRTETCKTVSPVPRVFVKDYFCNSYRGEETEMLKLLAEHGPIAVAADATTWHNYIGGIIQFHCSENINHAVQIVGYDLTGDIPYYIIRNSWGSNFGDHGYIYIKYGDNLCGLAVEVSHLTVTGYQ
ncbi:unnamed protein product [Candidula unifasciata]|uniref:Cathepsin O n=1 Tax=Candidula unifasciata TaxID=100452 RepID=A0A8S3ZB86_9EUPU|nr:unnamed protein product [Candidula unifasciata]